ncbi:hypothetical protein EG832_16815 [bacterium]|nr:hypothetical protein [bacterium]
MTLNISQLCDRVTAAHFSNVEQINDSIIRFVKADRDRPFAVFYLDLAQNLPITHEILTKYQDSIIGSD